VLKKREQYKKETVQKFVTQLIFFIVFFHKKLSFDKQDMREVDVSDEMMTDRGERRKMCFPIS
jgi:hypothetical protein